MWDAENKYSVHFNLFVSLSFVSLWKRISTLFWKHFDFNFSHFVFKTISLENILVLFTYFYEPSSCCCFIKFHSESYAQSSSCAHTWLLLTYIFSSRFSVKCIAMNSHDYVWVVALLLYIHHIFDEIIIHPICNWIL